MTIRTGMLRGLFTGLPAAAWLAITALAMTAGAQPPKPGDLGFTDTPILPGLKWHVHDPDRPHPKVVTPGKSAGDAPSDAIVLFDGKVLSKWAQNGRGADAKKIVDAQCPVRNGYFEVAPGTGPLFTRES